MVYKLPESELMAQGAEARLYKGNYLGKTVIIKERFEKKYRHPDLDTRLTKERIKSEARAIIRAKAAGVGTPTLYLVDYNRRSIFMEYIENNTVLKTFINKNLITGENAENLTNYVTSAIGRTIAKLHAKYIIHGDLTTSNILLKNGTNLVKAQSEHEVVENVVVIDFGLARVDATAEDAAVDLYVLERSLKSAHAELPRLFEQIYKSYQRTFKNEKLLSDIIIKYEDVKARGRKRTMVG